MIYSDHTIECWLHGSRFDLVTGRVLNPPAVKAVATYPTRISDGRAGRRAAAMCIG